MARCEATKRVEVVMAEVGMASCEATRRAEERVASASAKVVLVASARVLLVVR